MKPFPLITAHTGCMGMQEHSMESLHTALALGADVYEDDIRVTRDGEPVLCHDDKVLLADGSYGSLCSMSLRELDERLKEPLTRLESVLQQIRAAGIRMNLDIKTPASLEPVFDLVAQMDMTEQVFMSGCEAATAAEANRLGGHMSKLLNVDTGSFQRLSYTDAVLQACAESRETGCFGLNVPYQLVCPELLERAKGENLAVYVWTVAAESDMRAMANMGVDSITTRDVARLLAVKAEWNEAKGSLY